MSTEKVLTTNNFLQPFKSNFLKGLPCGRPFFLFQVQNEQNSSHCLSELQAGK